MKKHEGIIAGILGTIIIHLLGGILFVSMKFHSLKGERESDFLLIIEEFMPEEVFTKDDPASDNQDGERLSDTDLRISNIARNLANTDDDPVIDPTEYQDRVKEEMIRQGLLSEDNFIDEWKKGSEEADAASVTIAEKEQEELKEQTPPNFQGPTRVYYELSDRFHVKLPIPVYKCEGEGKVTVNIEVTPGGFVTSANIYSDKSTTNDRCMTETALLFARSSRFNRSINAPARQRGTITYHFVAQKRNE